MKYNVYSIFTALYSIWEPVLKILNEWCCLWVGYGVYLDVMKQILLLILLFTLSNQSFGQYSDLPNDIYRPTDKIPKNLKRIVQYSDSLIFNVVEYDKSGNELFKYYRQYVGEFWNGKYIIMITGNVFENNRIVKTYNLHSNAGFDIYSFEYDTILRQLKTFIFIKEKDLSDDKINSNPYKDIDTITTFNAILGVRHIQLIENKSRKKLTSIENMDSKGNLVTIVFYRPNGKKDKASVIYEYNKMGQLISEIYHDPIMKSGIKRIEHTYLENKLTQTIVKYGYNDTSELKLFRYNTAGLLAIQYLLRSKFINDGIVHYDFYKYSYTYNENGELIKETTSTMLTHSLTLLDVDDEIMEETEYFYDDNGYVIKEINHDYSSKTESTKNYRYELTFY